MADLTIAELAAATPGWLLPGEGEMLAQYATNRFCVEIGSYCGKSTVWVASTATHVVSIDPHRGNPEMAPGRECHHPEVWDDETGTIDSAPALRRTLWNAGLADKVTVICADANDVAPWFSHPIGMLFIDGSHDAPGPMKDYRAWGAKAEIVIFHDTPIPDVAEACWAAEADGMKLIDSVGSLKVFAQ